MLSRTSKRWQVPDEKEVRNASHVLARLYAARGIDPDAQPTLASLNGFPDMQRACDRISKAVECNEHIGVFGDYDCDGVTAIAQLVRYFRRRNTEPYVRLPHRVHDGYGLSLSVANEIIAEGVTVLITADTGIASVREIAHLRDAGVDVIVTDHHALHDELPPAYAIIHPLLSAQPLPHPSGSGVAFALVHALEQSAWIGMEEDLALAMFGTVADLVPLQGNNRALTQLGLQAFAQITSGPLSELRERCRSKDGVLTSTDIAFRIAPRINAAGRMEGPDIALRALLEGGEDLSRLDALNEHRQALSRSLYAQVESQFTNAQLPAMLSAVSGDFPHGIVGLLAGKLTETFGRPSMVAHTDGVSCTASLRSPACYNIVEGLQRTSDLLTSFGGHAQAAGCSFLLKDFDVLREKLNDDVREHVPSDLLVPTLTADAILNARDITLDFCRQLQNLQPFGQGNAEPLFLLKNVSFNDARPCGDGTHVQARIGGIKSIGFGMAQHVNATERFDVLGYVRMHEWNGKREAQIFIVDVATCCVQSTVCT